MYLELVGGSGLHEECCWAGGVGLVEEVCAAAGSDHRRGRLATQEADDPGELVVLTSALKERRSEEELCGNTSEGPHVNGTGGLEAEDDLWGAVAAGLDVCVRGRPHKAC